MWFKNILAYRISDDAYDLSAEQLDQALQSRPARPCANQEMFTLGFTAPFGRHSESLFQVIDGGYLIMMRREERILPGSVVKDALAEKIEEIESRDSRKVYKKERDTLKEEIIQSLLPRAFTRSSVTKAIIDMKTRMVFVDTASAKKAEDLLSLLREVVGSLPVRPLNVQKYPAVCMTEWVKKSLAPEDLYLMDSTTLLDTSEDGGKIAATKQDLSSDEIQMHLQSGKQVEKLALAYSDKLTFTIDDKLTIKSLRFEDILMDEVDHQTGEDSDMATQLNVICHIMLGTLRELYPILINAFGGEDMPQGV